MAYSKKEKINFIGVLRNKNGNVSKACLAFGISRVAYNNWTKDKWFADLVEEMKEEEIDTAEDQLRVHMKGVPEYKRTKAGKIMKDTNGNPIIIGWLIKPDPKAVQFFLERKGKERGYGREQKITIEDPPEMPKVSLGLTIITPQEDKKKKKSK